MMQEQMRKEKKVAEQRRKEAEIAAKKRAEEKAIQQKLADERRRAEEQKKKDQVTSQGESTQYNFQWKIQSGALVQNNKAFKDDEFYEGGNEVDTNHIYLDMDVEEELGNYA